MHCSGGVFFSQRLGSCAGGKQFVGICTQKWHIHVSPVALTFSVGSWCMVVHLVSVLASASCLNWYIRFAAFSFPRFSFSSRWVCVFPSLVSAVPSTKMSFGWLSHGFLAQSRLRSRVFKSPSIGGAYSLMHLQTFDRRIPRLATHATLCGQKKRFRIVCLSTWYRYGVDFGSIRGQSGFVALFFPVWGNRRR